VILLVTRLALGEFVHAHDGGHAAAVDTAVAQESAQCHDDIKPAGAPECCKTGGCDCPCLFAIAIESDVSLTLESTATNGTAVRAIGTPLDRSFLLFRPPATLSPFA